MAVRFDGPDMREFVLQEATEVTSAGGRVTRTFPSDGTGIAAVWGKLEPLRGYEARVAQQVQAGTTHRLTIRRPVERTATGAEVRPTSQMRFYEGDRLYEITAPPREHASQAFYEIDVAEKEA